MQVMWLARCAGKQIKEIDNYFDIIKRVKSNLPSELSPFLHFAH